MSSTPGPEPLAASAGHRPRVRIAAGPDAGEARPDEGRTRERHLSSSPSLGVCVVVPALNESRSVRRVIEEVDRELPTSHVVVVDDGSTDDTARIAADAGATVVSLPVNLGIGGAVQAGYRYALRFGYDVVIQVDGDGQHDPSEAPSLLEPLVSGTADMVVGSRWLGRGDYVAPAGRRFGMRMLAAMVRWRTGQRFSDTTSGFRALGPEAVRLFARSYPADFPEVESIVLAARHGLRIVEVPVKMTERRHGRSSIAGARSAYYMARVVLALLVDSLEGKDKT